MRVRGGRGGYEDNLRLETIEKNDYHSPGITAQRAYRNAQEAPPFQAMFRIIDSKYLLLGLIYLMGVGLQPVHKDQAPTN